MTQPSLFDIEIIDPAEVEPEEKRIRRTMAADAWNAAFLRRDYARKAAEILASGDPVRIRLYNDWQRRNMALNAKERAA